MLIPHITEAGLFACEDLEEAYSRMAADESREAEALEWAEALVGDALDEENQEANRK